MQRQFTIISKQAKKHVRIKVEGNQFDQATKSVRWMPWH